MDLEKGSSAEYVSADNTDFSYSSDNGARGGMVAMKAKLGSLSRNQIILFALCAILVLLGIISLFDGIIGIILGILTILLAIFGIVGGFLAQRKLLQIYLIGVGVLLIFTIVGLILDIVFISPFGLIVNLIMTIFYVACAVFGFMIYLKCK